MSAQQILFLMILMVEYDMTLYEGYYLLV